MSQIIRSSALGGSFMHQQMADPNQRQTQWSLSLILTIVTMITSGTFLIMGYKVQGIKYGYNHGVMQTAQMFVGEYLNIIIFFFLFSGKNKLPALFSDMKENSKTAKSKMKYTKLWMALTSFMDSMGSGLGITSLLLIPASVSLMLGGFTIIASAIVSRIFFNRKIHRHHFLGCMSTLVGFSLVGFSSIIGADGSTHSGSSNGTILGIVLVTVSTFITAIQQNTQEYLFRTLEIPPQREIGLEGFFGLIWIFNWLMLFSFIPCPDAGLCQIGGPLDDPVSGTIDMIASNGMIFWTVLTILGMGIFNWTNVSLVKRVSCMFSGFMGTMPTVSVWFASLAVGYETFDPKISGIQLGGFLFLVLGNFTYNEIIEIKLCGLNKKMSKYCGVKASETKGKEKKDKDDVMPSLQSGLESKLKSDI